MIEERNGKCLQVKYVRGHFWYRGSVTVNRVILVTQTAIIYTRNLYIKNNTHIEPRDRNVRDKRIFVQKQTLFKWDLLFT